MPSAPPRTQRAENWLATLERDRPASREDLLRLLEKRGLPKLEGALDLEERYGGLRAGETQFGPLGLLLSLPPTSSKAYRALPEGFPALIAAGSTPDEQAWFVDGRGHIYLSDGGPLHPAADSADIWVEKLALDAVALSAPRAVTIELHANVGEAIAGELRLGPVLEATDSASAWWKGTDIVAEVPVGRLPVRLLCASIKAASEAFATIVAPGAAIPVRLIAARPPPPTPLGKGPKIPEDGTLPFAPIGDGDSGMVFLGRIAGRPTIEQVRTRKGLMTWETFSDGGHARREERR